MTISALLLGIILATFYGSLFHLWQNGGISRFFLYIVLSWVGFWVGHFLAGWIGWTFLSIGPLHLGLATTMSFIVLFIGNWLSFPIKKKSGVS